MEVGGSFHGNTYCEVEVSTAQVEKLSLLPFAEDSTTIFGGSFHERPYTPTEIHLLPRVS